MPCDISDDIKEKDTSFLRFCANRNSRGIPAVPGEFQGIPISFSVGMALVLGLTSNPHHVCRPANMYKIMLDHSHLFRVAEVPYHLLGGALYEHGHTRDTDDHPEESSQSALGQYGAWHAQQRRVRRETLQDIAKRRPLFLFVDLAVAFIRVGRRRSTQPVDIGRALLVRRAAHRFQFRRRLSSVVGTVYFLVTGTGLPRPVTVHRSLYLSAIRIPSSSTSSFLLLTYNINCNSTVNEMVRKCAS